MWNIGGLIHLEVYVKRIFIHVHMHLRLVKFESFLDKQEKMSYMLLDMSQKIKGEFRAGYTSLGVISIWMKRQGKRL